MTANRYPVTAPPEAVAHNARGIVLYEGHDWVGAEAAYRAALAIDGDYADALNNLGIVLRLRGQLAEAHNVLMRALALRPAYAEALNNLGHIYRVDGRYGEAHDLFERAIELRPDYPEAHNNIGMMLGAQGRYDEAEPYIRKAIDLMPDYAGAHNNLGVIRQAHGDFKAAMGHYTVAIALEPRYVEAHNNLALCLLAAGRYREGWRKHESRWDSPFLRAQRRFTDIPLWQGEPLAGKRILLHAEQGLGDTLQFARYIPMVEAMGAKVIVDVPLALVRLIKRMARLEAVFAFGIMNTEALETPDYQCPLMSLPLHFGTELHTVPAQVPYLDVHPVEQALWRERLQPYAHKRLIGLAWAGNPRIFSDDLAAVDRRRSMTFDQIAPLLTLPDSQFVSLQKDAPPNDLGLLDFTDQLVDYADTAALMLGLDLIITVDTSVVHMAGALGKPVWLMNRYDSCWRWLRGRDDSPWYPTLRQFRQPAPGDWASVVGAIHQALRQEGV